MSNETSPLSNSNRQMFIDLLIAIRCYGAGQDVDRDVRRHVDNLWKRHSDSSRTLLDLLRVDDEWRLENVVKAMRAVQSALREQEAGGRKLDDLDHFVLLFIREVGDPPDKIMLRPDKMPAEIGVDEATDMLRKKASAGAFWDDAHRAYRSVVLNHWLPRLITGDADAALLKLSDELPFKF